MVKAKKKYRYTTLALFSDPEGEFIKQIRVVAAIEGKTQRNLVVDVMEEYFTKHYPDIKDKIKK